MTRTPPLSRLTRAELIAEVELERTISDQRLEEAMRLRRQLDEVLDLLRRQRARCANTQTGAQ